jgi:hypothetical protein
MSRFDPIAAGMRNVGVRSWSFDKEDAASIDIVKDHKADVWFATIWVGVTKVNEFNIPASFDHAHVVALLRANGADIEGGGDE